MYKIMIEHLFVGNTDSFDKISISYRSLFQTGRRGFKSYGRNNSLWKLEFSLFLSLIDSAKSPKEKSILNHIKYHNENKDDEHKKDLMNPELFAIDPK